MSICEYLHVISNSRKCAVICVAVTQGWVDGVHRRIAAAIKIARGTRSAQWLADETERLGYPISRAAIANYESGRKKGLDVVELMVIAAVLDVPPVALLYPELPDGGVEVLPTLRVKSWDAAAWVTGEGLSPWHAGNDSEVTTEFRLINAVRALNAQIASVSQLSEMVLQFVKGELPGQQGIDPSGPLMQLIQLQMKTTAGEIKRLEAEVLERGGVIDD